MVCLSNQLHQSFKYISDILVIVIYRNIEKFCQWVMKICYMAVKHRTSFTFARLILRASDFNNHEVIKHSVHGFGIRKKSFSPSVLIRSL